MGTEWYHFLPPEKVVQVSVVMDLSGLMRPPHHDAFDESLAADGSLFAGTGRLFLVYFGFLLYREAPGELPGVNGVPYR